MAKKFGESALWRKANEAQNDSVIGASPVCDYLWRQVSWQELESPVRRLQMGIAKAVQQI
jgi:hypothetical protein